MLKGDEFHHYQTTEDGFLITKADDGVYRYASMDKSGIITATPVKANDKRVRNSSESIYLSSFQPSKTIQNIHKQVRIKRSIAKQTVQKAILPAKFPKTGSPKSLVILVNFSDRSYVVPTPQTAFNNLLNQAGYSANGSTGSARDYFRDNSAGAFEPEFDVVGPYTLPNKLNYYGKNDAAGDDVNPLQLIIDACNAADNAGVDFSVYDTDGDNKIDNVFVYYAGYNEAENGPANTIWPHRWGIYPISEYGNEGNYTGTVASITFDGKVLIDYACTSELKETTGSKMCGIGTFTHEFGHVLGLADMYATDGSEHETLSFWNIMDAGAYLNQGRTPPAYNAFERLQLGYMTPEILAGVANGTLSSLTSSNKAYLITETDTHNLNGENPSPTEFFLLENRQKTGWDKYLPGHGLLIYRINYNQNDWDYNQPNNDPDAMGVDIMEADSIADGGTLAGDPFPGTSKTTTYEFTLRAGTKLYKKITDITEVNGVITFDVQKVAAINVNADTLNFTASVDTSAEPQTVTISGINITNATLQYAVSGDDAAMFTCSGDGTLASLGGTLDVTFSPTSEGTKIAKLTVTDGAIEQIITLSGVASLPPLGVPAVPAEVSSISINSNGFVATWNAVSEAESYVLNVYTKTAGTGEKSILAENFDLFTRGFANGSASSTDISSSLNKYTHTAGWSGDKVFEAGGSVKMGSSSYLGYLVTPVVDLSAEGGAFTLKFDAMAWSKDATSLKIYLDNVLVATVTGLNNSTYTLKSFSFPLSGGKNASNIKFEGNQISGGRFFLDNLSITQAAGDVLTPVPDAPFNTLQKTTYQVTGLHNSDSYYYTVYAVKGTQKSATSNEVGPIKLLPTGIKSICSDTLTVLGKNGKIVFNATAGETVEVFNTAGQRVYDAPAVDGLNTVGIANKGVIIVKVGNRTGKVVL